MVHFAEIDRAVPRPDQEEALAAVAAWASEPMGRGQLIEAPGTGKTLLGHWVAERLNPPLVVYAAPSLSLLDQTLRVWAGQQPDGRVQRLVVCSDATVADDLPAARLTIPPTTDLAHIRAWLSHQVPPGTQKQVFVTYQSAARVGAALRELGAPAPLLLADEAHRLAAPGPSLFRAVLDDRLFPTRRRLFLTGTPRVGRVLGPDGRLLEPELSLDDRSRFGPVLHRLSFADAIGLGLLADYELDVVLTEPSFAPEAIGDVAALLAAVAADLGSGRIRRAFSFHLNCAAADQFRQRLAAALHQQADPPPFDGSWVTETVFGTHPVNARVATLAALRARGGVVASVRALSEGIDLPELDAVLLVDPKRSTVDIAQSIGRALRRDTSNPAKRARIIVPVLSTGAPSPDLLIQSEAWAPVWRVLSALAAHDERLAAELARSTRYAAAGRSGVPATPAVAPALPVRFRVPDGVAECDLARAFALAAVVVTADPFEEGFGHLEAFVAEHGHASVPVEWVSADGFALGRWVASQLRTQAQGRLGPERVDRLSGLAGWKWSTLDPDWDLGYSVLRQFVRGHRHARVPLGWMDRRGIWLGSWVMSVRAAYHAGLLRPEHARCLEKLPGWTWGHPEASAAWSASVARRTPSRRPNAGNAARAQFGSLWERAVARVIRTLPRAARQLGRDEPEHARWAPTDAQSTRPSPFTLLVDALTPWLRRHLRTAGKAKRGAQRGFQRRSRWERNELEALHHATEAAWFPRLVTDRRPTDYLIRDVSQALNAGSHERLHNFPQGLLPGVPAYSFSLVGDDPSAASLRGALPFLSGWAPPAVDEVRQALTTSLQNVVARAAVPIAAGIDLRAVAFTQMLRWADRRWGTPTKTLWWLTDRLLQTTFADPSMRELWLGKRSDRAVERALQTLISEAGPEADDEANRHRAGERHATPFRAVLEQTAKRALKEVGRELLERASRIGAGQFCVATVGERGSPVHISLRGTVPYLRLPRHALMGARSARAFTKLAKGPPIHPILLRRRRDIATRLQVAHAWEGIWVRVAGKAQSVIEAGLLVGMTETVEHLVVWPQNEKGLPSVPSRRPEGTFPWPLRPPADWTTIAGPLDAALRAQVVAASEALGSPHRRSRGGSRSRQERPR